MKRYTRMADAPHVAVLAAGRGSRFGGGKLEANCAGKPLGRWALDAVAGAGLGPDIIVTGPDGVSFADGWSALVNPHPERGLGSSLALAANVARDADAPSLLVLLADMPLVSSAYLRGLAAVAAPAATRQRHGHGAVKQPGEHDAEHDEAPVKQKGHPLRHVFTRAIPTAQCMNCHMHQPNIFLNSFLGYTMWDYESDAPLMWPGPDNITPKPEGMSDEE